MTLRSTVIAAAFAVALLAPVTASAREQGLGDAAAKLSDPRLQNAMAGAIAAMSEAMLDMKMAPFAKAMESMGDKDAAREIDPDATLRDMAGPEAARMPQELSRKVPAMMGAMAGMAGAMEAMLPQFKAMGERMKDAMPRE